MKSDDHLCIVKHKGVIVVTADVSGEEILELVIAETLALEPWFGPSDDDLEKYEARREEILAARYMRRNTKRRAFHKSVCPVAGCGKRKLKTSEVCYRHNKKPMPATNPFEQPTQQHAGED